MTKHLIPYIKAAETAAGKISWYSHHRGQLRGLDEDKRQTNGKTAGNPYIKATIVNGKLTKRQIRCLRHTAKYFVKYLSEYHDKGIDIKALTPQNEPTMEYSVSVNRMERRPA